MGVRELVATQLARGPKHMPLPRERLGRACIRRAGSLQTSKCVSTKGRSAPPRSSDILIPYLGADVAPATSRAAGREAVLFRRINGRKACEIRRFAPQKTCAEYEAPGHPSHKAHRDQAIPSLGNRPCE